MNKVVQKTSLSRRSLLKKAGVGLAAGVGIAAGMGASAPAVNAQPTLRWRLASSFPKSNGRAHRPLGGFCQDSGRHVRR